MVQEIVDDMLPQGVIEPAWREWSSPDFLLQKREISWRFRIEYRRLNTTNIWNTYLIPGIVDFMNALGEATWISALNVNSGYWQVPLPRKNETKPHSPVNRIFIGFEDCRLASLTHSPLFSVPWISYSADSTRGGASYIWTTRSYSSHQLKGIWRIWTWYFPHYANQVFYSTRRSTASSQIL